MRQANTFEAKRVASDITSRLQDAVDGDETAWHEVFKFLYEDLQFIAHRHLLKERKNHTLNTQGLVHEVYMKLVRLDRISWENRAHFLSMASRMMRHVLVSYATRRNREKRGGKDLKQVELDDFDLITEEQAGEVIAVHEALDDLARLNTRHSQIVECRFFGGLTIAETAKGLNISPATVKREWAFLRTWLMQHLSAP